MLEERMSKQDEISPELVASLLRYEPKTGRLFWLERGRDHFTCSRLWAAFNTARAGVEAFSSTNNRGYRQGAIKQRKFTAHRVAWALHYGEWPKGEIDHINGVRTDNRIENLRDVTASENRKNAARYRNNTSGVTGVSWFSQTNRWTAHIRKNGRAINLGYFLKFDDAVAARKAAEAEAGFHRNHGRVS